MAKVQQKSEKITAFGGIFFVLDKFDSILSSVIDSHLGLRSTLIGTNQGTNQGDRFFDLGLDQRICPLDSQIEAIATAAHSPSLAGIPLQQYR